MNFYRLLPIVLLLIYNSSIEQRRNRNLSPVFEDNQALCHFDDQKQN